MFASDWSDVISELSSISEHATDDERLAPVSTLTVAEASGPAAKRSRYRERPDVDSLEQLLRFLASNGPRNAGLCRGPVWRPAAAGGSYTATSSLAATLPGSSLPGALAGGTLALAIQANAVAEALVADQPVPGSAITGLVLGLVGSVGGGGVGHLQAFHSWLCRRIVGECCRLSILRLIRGERVRGLGGVTLGDNWVSLPPEQLVAMQRLCAWCGGPDAFCESVFECALFAGPEEKAERASDFARRQAGLAAAAGIGSFCSAGVDRPPTVEQFLAVVQQVQAVLLHVVARGLQLFDVAMELIGMCSPLPIQRNTWPQSASWTEQIAEAPAEVAAEAQGTAGGDLLPRSAGRGRRYRRRVVAAVGAAGPPVFATSWEEADDLAGGFGAKFYRYSNRAMNLLCGLYGAGLLGNLTRSHEPLGRPLALARAGVEAVSDGLFGRRGSELQQPMIHLADIDPIQLVGLSIAMLRSWEQRRQTVGCDGRTDLVENVRWLRTDGNTLQAVPTAYLHAYEAVHCDLPLLLLEAAAAAAGVPPELAISSLNAESMPDDDWIANWVAGAGSEARSLDGLADCASLSVRAYLKQMRGMRVTWQLATLPEFFEPAYLRSAFAALRPGPVRSSGEAALAAERQWAGHMEVICRRRQVPVDESGRAFATEDYSVVQLGTLLPSLSELLGAELVHEWLAFQRQTLSTRFAGGMPPGWLVALPWWDLPETGPAIRCILDVLPSWDGKSMPTDSTKPITIQPVRLSRQSEETWARLRQARFPPLLIVAHGPSGREYVLSPASSAAATGHWILGVTDVLAEHRIAGASPDGPALELSELVPRPAHLRCVATTASLPMVDSERARSVRASLITWPATARMTSD